MRPGFILSNFLKSCSFSCSFIADSGGKSPGEMPYKPTRNFEDFILINNLQILK
jgi:hypothetical protein